VNCLLVTVLVGLGSSGCGGPAGCPPFDEQCQDAVAFAAERTHQEPASVQEMACEEPVADALRCWIIVAPPGGVDLRVSLHRHGDMMLFEP